MPRPLIGVDLGTSKAALAVYREDGAEVILNDVGGRTTASVVYTRPPHTLVGEAALRMAVAEPRNTIRNVKCILGRSMKALHDDAGWPTFLGAVKTERDLSRNGLHIHVESDQKRPRQAFPLTPEEVVAMLLHEMKKAAQVHLGTEVAHCVVAVPSYFDMRQRYATVQAATLAGLTVVGILNEPSAAALVYAMDREAPRTAVIVDVGGGGGSVSVIDLREGGKVRVLAASGARLPGGRDFDLVMMKYLLQVIKEEHNKHIRDAQALEVLRGQWTKAKHQLSRIPVVKMDTFLPGDLVELQRDITRAEFEAQCGELFERIVQHIVETVMEARVEAVDDVVLVGGSTRTPRLRQLIEAQFPGRLCKAVNPDEAVACGAALHCAAAAGAAVRLDREVSGLLTVVEHGRNGYSLQPNTDLPLYKQLHSYISTTFTVRQGETEESLRIMFTGQVNECIKSFELTRDGLFDLHMYNGITKRLLFPDCLSQRKMDKIKEKILRQQREEGREASRVIRKNFLEKLLRDMLSNEVQDNDVERANALALQNTCREQLEWLMSNPDVSKQEVECRLGSIKLALEKLELKRKTVMARKRLQEALDELQNEMEETSETTQKLVAQCRSVSKMLSSEPGAEECERRLAELKEAREVLSLKKEESKRLLARDLLSNTLKVVAEAQESCPRPLEEYAVRRQRALQHLLSRERQWFEDNPDAPEPQLVSHRENTQNRFAQIKKQYEADRNDGEGRRLMRARSRLEGRMKQLIHLQELKGKEKSLELLKVCRSCLAFVTGRPELTEDLLNDVAEKLDKALLEFCPSEAQPAAPVEKPQSNQVEQEEIQDLVEAALAEEEAEMRNSSAAGERGGDPVRAGGEDAATPADSDELLRAGGEGDAPATKDSQPRCGQKRPALSAAASAPPEKRRQIEAEADTPKAATRRTVLSILQRWRRDIFQSTFRPWELRIVTRESLALSQQLKEHTEAVLQCLAQEVAVQALSEARASGAMAFIVDKAAIPGGRVELMSLSVRFVPESAAPVERVLIAWDCTRGPVLEEVVVALTEIWMRAEVTTKDLVLGVSAEAAGPAGRRLMQTLNAVFMQDYGELLNSTVRLDARIARVVYDEPEDSPAKNFFSFLDAFRDFFSVKSREDVFREQCPSLEDATWRTYEDMIRFVMREFDNLSEGLRRVYRHDPSTEFLVAAFLEKVLDAAFITSLVAFHEIFNELTELSRTLTYTGELDSLNLACDSQCVRLLTHQDFSTSVITIVKSYFEDPADFTKLQATLTGHVQHCCRVTVHVIEKCRDECLVLNVVLGCLRTSDHQPRVLSANGAEFEAELSAELRALRARCPEVATSSSPSSLLRALPRAEMQEQFPRLAEALSHALTLPLLPLPQRSSDQLRRAARLLATCPPDRVGPVVVLSQDAGQFPLTVPLEGVVDILADKVPFLRDSLL